MAETITHDQLRPGDRVEASPHTNPGVVVRILRESEQGRDPFGRPITRYWGVREDTGEEGFISFGPGGVVRRLSSNTALVKCGSHRAREKMLRLVGRDNAQALFSMRRDTGTGGVYRIPAELAPAAKQITGVTGFRDGEDLLKCWPSPSMRELVSPD